jgi:[acyl-carrier-protein] S-malonyltransferase
MFKTALLFAGQGAQFAGMGRDFAAGSSMARAIFERANQVLGYDLASICFEGPDSELTKTEHAQPGIFLVSWVAFRLLQERLPGFCFHAAAGLSLGEFTALAAAGALEFEDALRVVHQRGKYMQEACDTTRGSMAAVLGLEAEKAREVCDAAGVAVANLNCPGQIVISGASERIEKACELAKSRGARRALPLNVAGAYHSPLMASACPRLGEALAGVRLQHPSVQVISNVTARPHGAPADILQRLVEQVTATVRWEESVRFLLAENCTHFLELGPGTALTGFMKRIEPGARVLNIGDINSLEAAIKAFGAG